MCHWHALGKFQWLPCSENTLFGVYRVSNRSLALFRASSYSLNTVRLCNYSLFLFIAEPPRCLNIWGMAGRGGTSHQVLQNKVNRCVESEEFRCFDARSSVGHGNDRCHRCTCLILVRLRIQNLTQHSPFFANIYLPLCFCLFPHPTAWLREKSQVKIRKRQQHSE